jgi:hypothetical protein
MKFRIGEWIGAATGLPGQTRGLIVFGDCNTTVAAIQNWWRHSRIPPAITFARASSFACKIADDATGDVVGTSRPARPLRVPGRMHDERAEARLGLLRRGDEPDPEHRSQHRRQLGAGRDVPHLRR